MDPGRLTWLGDPLITEDEPFTGTRYVLAACQPARPGSGQPDGESWPSWEVQDPDGDIKRAYWVGREVTLSV